MAEISGLPSGMSVFSASAPPFNLVLDDNNAEVLRRNALYRPTPPGPIVAPIVAVRIDNSHNPGKKVWLKVWDVPEPAVGNTPPFAILRCRAGKITEYYLRMEPAVLSYQVLTAPGTKGTVAPERPVRVTIALAVP